MAIGTPQKKESISVTTQMPDLNVKCSECPIRHRAVCARCDADELEQLEQVKFYRSYEAGQTIAWAGDELAFVASVVSGVVALGQTLEDGRTQMLGLLLPSDFVGRPGRVRSEYEIHAETNVTLCCFRRKPFEKLLAETPHIGARLLEMTMDELDAAREWMLLLGSKTAREKIASFLAIFARRETGPGFPSNTSRVTFDLPLTRKSMAEYLGLTLETVSRQMSSLKQAGTIQLEGKRRVIVPDLARLLEETGDDVDGGLIV